MQKTPLQLDRQSYLERDEKISSAGESTRHWSAAKSHFLSDPLVSLDMLMPGIVLIWKGKKKYTKGVQ